MTHFTSKAVAATIALAVSAGFGVAQESGQGGQGGQGEHTTFDIDRNPETGEAAYEDFTRSFDEGGAYEAWDMDQDGVLSRDEYNRGMFSTYDVDGSGSLSEEEIVGMQSDRLFADETVKAGGAATETQD